MGDLIVSSAVAGDVAAAAEVVAALQSSLYSRSAFSQADLEDYWSGLDLERNARVVRDGDRIVGYGAVRGPGECWWAAGYVHPDARGRGIGRLIAQVLEQEAARSGALTIMSSVFEADVAGRRLFESLGYVAVRIFRELRIELQEPPRAPAWPDGLHTMPFDPEHDARAFHAAHEEAFADHWDYTPQDFETWSKHNLESARFDAALWCVVRAGSEIVAGTTCTAQTFGGGWVEALFTRRAWRKKGVGTGLVHDALGRFWGRGEHSVGLGVDAANKTGAFRIYERAGMAPVLGLVVHEKRLGDSGPAAGRE